MGWVESPGAEVRYAMRTLRRRPGFSVVAVLTLALGIGANTAIFSVFRSVVLRPLPYDAPEELVALDETFEGVQGYSDGTRIWASYRSYLTWRDEASTVMREPVIMIGLFGALTAGAMALARALPSAGKQLAEAFGWASLIWVNVALWAGSLWGDYPGESFVPKSAFEASSHVTYFSKALAIWRETAVHIPDIAFALVWAVALTGVGIWAGMRGRRGVVNGVAVLGTIHMFSQWFEHLKTSPATVIAAGILAVIIAVLLWAYNKAKADEAGSSVSSSGVGRSA